MTEKPLPVEENPSCSKDFIKTLLNEAFKNLLQGKYHIEIQDYKFAVQRLSTACELYTQHFGELALECGEVHFLYGKALFCLSLQQAGKLRCAFNEVVAAPEKFTEKISSSPNVLLESTASPQEAHTPFSSPEFDSFSFCQLASNSQGLTKRFSTGSDVFAWAGTPLFQNLSISDNDPGAEVVQCPDIHFKPAIPLPSLIEVKTGEEDEKAILVFRAKLFRYDSSVKQWKERGVGDIKILSHKEKVRFRIILRRDQVHKVACNHFITEDMTITPLETSESALCWTALDYSDGMGEARQFAVRFRHKEQNKRFRKVFLACQKKLRAQKWNVLWKKNTADHTENGKEPFQSINSPQAGVLDEAEIRQSEQEKTLYLKQAWNSLEMAKSIFLRQGGNDAEAQLQVAEILQLFAEISMESGNNAAAINDLKICLDIKRRHLKPFHRLSAEAFYQLGVAQMLEKMYCEAFENFSITVNILQLRIDNLKSTPVSNTVANFEHDDYEKEIAGLERILADIRKKMEDMEELIKKAAKQGNIGKGFPNTEEKIVSNVYQIHSPSSKSRTIGIQELNMKFDIKFKRYSNRGKRFALTQQGCMEWLRDAGIVGQLVTTEEANRAFKDFAGMKVGLDKCDFKRFATKIARLKNLNSYDLYQTLCEAAENI